MSSEYSYLEAVGAEAEAPPPESQATLPESSVLRTIQKEASVLAQGSAILQHFFITFPFQRN